MVGLKWFLSLESLGHDLAVLFINPGVQACERADRGRDIDVDTQVAQASKARRDVQRDVVVGTATREPRPGPILHLQFGELAQAAASSSFNRLASNRIPTFRRASLSCALAGPTAFPPTTRP